VNSSLLHDNPSFVSNNVPCRKFFLLQCPQMDTHEHVDSFQSEPNREQIDGERRRWVGRLCSISSKKHNNTGKRMTGVNEDFLEERGWEGLREESGRVYGTRVEARYG
jgi:hypothetical protein